MILVRHAQSVVDATIPAADWSLAPAAVDAAAALGALLGQTFDVPARTVVASTERKAVDTAAALGLGPVLVSEAFCEVTRPFYDAPDGLGRAVQQWFRGETVSGWEPMADAVERFARGLEGHDREGLVVVTHGTVMTAWLASTGALDDPFGFWSDLRMPDAWKLGPTLVRCPAPS